MDSLAGERRDLEHRCVAEKCQLAVELALDVEPPLGVVDQLPFVEQQHDRTTGRVDTLGEALVLAGDALGGVDHHQRDVGVVDGAQRADQ